jgi:glutathionyl-hydroquinone reductase
MGQLVDGVWKTDWYEPDSKGAFQRPDAQFRGSITEAEAEVKRYHLYASYACPWAQRALVTRSVRELDNAIDVTIVDAKMGDDGWQFGGELGDPEDPLFGAKFLREIYLRANPKYTGRVTVPVLWDKKSGSIVNNESREVMRLLDTVFDRHAKTGTRLYPRGLEAAVDDMLDTIYAPYNNGVYRAGFATSQSAYEDACRDVFATLDECERILAKQRFLCGDVFTEADVAMFTTSLRFDLVYYSHFKLNMRRLADYPNVWAYVREIYQMPAVKRTCRLDHIKTHYYWSQVTVNPHRIVPLGPMIDFTAPHNRQSVIIARPARVVGAYDAANAANAAASKSGSRSIGGARRSATSGRG